MDAKAIKIFNHFIQPNIQNIPNISLLLLFKDGWSCCDSVVNSMLLWIFVMQCRRYHTNFNIGHRNKILYANRQHLKIIEHWPCPLHCHMTLQMVLLWFRHLIGSKIYIPHKLLLKRKLYVWSFKLLLGDTTISVLAWILVIKMKFRLILIEIVNKFDTDLATYAVTRLVRWHCSCVDTWLDLK